MYKPKFKIVLASSFEGIINNGVYECALTSFNAYQNMPEGKNKFFRKSIEPKEFSVIKNSKEIEAFLRLRPLVEIAEDYLTVIELIEKYPRLIDEMLQNPKEESSYLPLIEKFEEIKSESPERRKRFKEEFYRERERMQKRDYENWLNLQEPFSDTIAEFRTLVNTQKRINGRDSYSSIISGFVPWFSTSKDETSTYNLCSFYTKVMKLYPTDVAENGKFTCMISRDRIIGLEHTRDKVEQLKTIAKKENIPRAQVWRINDRYDPKQQIQLRDEGFAYQFLLKGGYVFPHDIKKAENDPTIIILERKNFAKTLGEFAKKWGF